MSKKKNEEDEQRNLNTLSTTKKINVVLLTCVSESFFESFRRDLNGAKPVYIFEDYLICRFVDIKPWLRLKFRETSLTINSHQGRHSQEHSSRLWLQLSGTSCMVPRVDICEERRDDGRRKRPLTTVSSQILHQQCKAISTLFTGEPTYTLHLVYFPAFFYLWLGILPLNNKRLQTT